ncbi:hypothetical protein HDV00_007462 [Rhizophlyctis rosea]|nr:hypothetical protein HDV00_007462 [Rhizophlyctis rosea]
MADQEPSSPDSQDPSTHSLEAATQAAHAAVAAAAAGGSDTTADQVQQMSRAFWQQQITDIEHGPLDFKFHQLPLARIKKVMKADEDVKMISAEAPMIFSKACEIFILELTMRSWIHTEENKRRTLQKSDVATAVSKADMYDFLIDIVPREEMNKTPTIPGLKDMPFAYIQNSQYLQGLTPEQQTQLLAYQLANGQASQSDDGEAQAESQDDAGGSSASIAEQQQYYQQLLQQHAQLQQQQAGQNGHHGDGAKLVG